MVGRFGRGDGEGVGRRDLDGVGLRCEWLGRGFSFGDGLTEAAGGLRVAFRGLIRISAHDIYSPGL